MIPNRMHAATYLLGLALLTGVLGSSHADATILTFEQIRSNGNVVPAGNGGTLPQDYGDRVTGLNQNVPGGVFTYGNGGEGFTPNILVGYGPNNANTQVWNTNYGNLSHVIWNNAFTPFRIQLAPDPGFRVTLHGFDLAGWPNTDYTINSIQVLDGLGAVLFSQNNVHIEGDANGPQHSHFEFPISSNNGLFLVIDTLNLQNASDHIGLDNLRFSQLQSSGDPNLVPEPSGLLLLGLGAAIALCWRKLA